MKTAYKFIFAFLACLVCGCPRTPATVDAGTDLGSSEVPVGTDVAGDSDSLGQ